MLHLTNIYFQGPGSSGSTPGSGSGSGSDSTSSATASALASAASTTSSSTVDDSTASTSSSSTSRTTAPSGSTTVCSSGCDYKTIQEAVDAVADADSAAVIYISAGTYSEQVTIKSAPSAGLTIYGETEDTSSYSGNKVSIEHSSSLASGAANDESTGTLIIEAENVAVYNIDIKNTYGKGSQAIALAAYNTNQGYYGVGL